MAFSAPEILFMNAGSTFTRRRNDVNVRCGNAKSGYHLLHRASFLFRKWLRAKDVRVRGRDKRSRRKLCNLTSSLVERVSEVSFARLVYLALKNDQDFCSTKLYLSLTIKVNFHSALLDLFHAFGCTWVGLKCFDSGPKI